MKNLAIKNKVNYLGIFSLILLSLAIVTGCSDDDVDTEYVGSISQDIIITDTNFTLTEEYHR